MSHALRALISILLLAAPLAPALAAGQAAPSNGFIEIQAPLPSFDTIDYHVAPSGGSLLHKAVIRLGDGLPVDGRIEISLSIEVGLGSLDGIIVGEGSIATPSGVVIIEFDGDISVDTGLFQTNVTVSAASEGGKATAVVEAYGSLNEIIVRVAVESEDSSIDSIRLAAFLARTASESLAFMKASLEESGWTCTLSEEWSFTGYRGELRAIGGGYPILPKALALVTPVYNLAAALYTSDDVYMDYSVMEINTSIVISSGESSATLTASGETSLITPFAFTEAFLDNNKVKTIIAGPPADVEGLSYALCKLQGGTCNRASTTVSGAVTPTIFLGADRLQLAGATSFIYPFRPVKDLTLESSEFLVLLPAGSTINTLSLEPGDSALRISGSFSEVIVEHKGSGRPEIAWSNGIEYSVNGDTLMLRGEGDILIEVVYGDETGYGEGTAPPAATVTVTVTQVKTETVTVTTTITETVTRTAMLGAEEDARDSAGAPALDGMARVAQAPTPPSEPGSSRVVASIAAALTIALLIAVPLATYFVLVGRR